MAAIAVLVALMLFSWVLAVAGVVAAGGWVHLGLGALVLVAIVGLFHRQRAT